MDIAWQLVLTLSMQGSSFQYQQQASLEINQVVKETASQFKPLVKTKKTPALPVMVIHTGKKIVYFKDQPLRFTAAEFRILLLLASNQGNYIAKADLYSASVDDYAAIGNDTALKTRIKKIRQKLGESGRYPQYLKCLTGHGYCLDNTVQLEVIAVKN